VTVPFDELKPELDAAYKKVAGQVRIQGFRPGKVPPRVLDQRVGRGVVLDEAVNSAIPRLYGEALQAEDIAPVSQPDLDITEFADGDKLAFTAEVDVRPQFDLPAFESLSVTVDDVSIDEAKVDEQLESLRERFAKLTPVSRPAKDGDYVTLDLAATVDGEEVPGGTASGLSYQVGSGDLLEGIDEVLRGASEGDAKMFQTTLVAGELEGRLADVAVTIRGVSERELPEADDAWAVEATGFESLEALKADVRSRLDRVQRLEQGVAARDKVLEALLATIDAPLPDSVVETEVEWRKRATEEQLAAPAPTSPATSRPRARRPRSSRPSCRPAPARPSRRRWCSTRSPTRRSSASTTRSSPTRSSAGPPAPASRPTSTPSRSSPPVSCPASSPRSAAARRSPPSWRPRPSPTRRATRSISTSCATTCPAAARPTRRWTTTAGRTTCTTTEPSTTSTRTSPRLACAGSETACFAECRRRPGG
jgi:trigger factor